MRLPGYLGLILYKGLADLNTEASRAYIGFVWWVLEPLLYMGAFYVAFGLGLRGGGPGMLFFLLCGLVPWKWFQSAVSNGSHTIQSNIGLIQQIYLPKYILPGIVLVTTGIKFLIILALLLVLAIGVGHEPALPWLALPVLILAELAFALAAASLAGAVVPLIPDLGLIIDNGLIVMMFLSGIFFSVKKMPHTAQVLIEINPMVAIINGYRDILIDHQWPDWGNMGYVFAVSTVIYAVGYGIMRHFDRVYPKVMIG
ncbi:MAG TPA: ABC transporter permease [Gammaproteobacteria bacterium]|nr:ABC transporter permease [Gammaproteobacteria bacterium]